MALEKYSIGGTVQETEAFEAFADIPQNRVLLAEKLTADPPIKPEIIEGLNNVEQVFEYFKPKINVELETEEGTQRQETFSFKGLSDFGVKGITAQSNLLNELTLKKEQYQKIIRQLKMNKLLKQALTDERSKESLVMVLSALIMELEGAK
ncbi:MAG: hypothetical protein ICV66_06020 [Chitinophagaceae bacterium]|nr:hypothetical protein [Chitinophagaceae bacterium]